MSWEFVTFIKWCQLRSQTESFSSSFFFCYSEIKRKTFHTCSRVNWQEHLSVVQGEKKSCHWQTKASDFTSLLSFSFHATLFFIPFASFIEMKKYSRHCSEWNLWKWKQFSMLWKSRFNKTNKKLLQFKKIKKILGKFQLKAFWRTFPKLLRCNLLSSHLFNRTKSGMNGIGNQR